MRRFLVGSGSPLDQIQPIDAARHVARLSETGLSRSSIANHISAMRSFVSYAEDLGAVAPGILQTLKSPRVLRPELRRHLSRDEAERLVAGARQIGPPAHAAVSLMLTTGMRVSEVARARWKDLFTDEAGNVGLVVTGKGGKDRIVVVKPTVLRILAEERRRRGAAEDRFQADFTPLIVSRRGLPFSTSGLWKLVKSAARSSGLDKPISPHWLRHTFGTLAAQGGASPFQIQADMGHAQLSTSQRYIHLTFSLANTAARYVDIDINVAPGTRSG